VPTVAPQTDLILKIQTDMFWEDITVEILEDVRRRLRLLVDLIQPQERKVVITDFEDEIGGGEVIDLPEVGDGIDRAKFKMKVRRFVETHLNHLALQKIRRAEPVTKTDIQELENMLIEQGVAGPETLQELRSTEPLGSFLRRLVGLDRTAAKSAFSAFVGAYQLNADQTEFVDMVIDHLTENGIVEPSVFYESPFSDLDDMGIAGVFTTEQVAQVISIVGGLNRSAEAA